TCEPPAAAESGWWARRRDPRAAPTRRAPPVPGTAGAPGPAGPGAGLAPVGDPLVPVGVLGDGERVHQGSVQGARLVAQLTAVHLDDLVGLGVADLDAGLGPVGGPVAVGHVVHLRPGHRHHVDRSGLHGRVGGAVGDQVAAAVGVVVALEYQVDVVLLQDVQ